MKKIVLLVTILLFAMLFCGCEALSLAENAQPMFAGPDYPNEESYYREYYYPRIDFEKAPEAIFRPLAYGKEYIEKPLYIVGNVEETTYIDGIKYYILSTEYGEIYINNKLFTMEKIKDGTEVTMYFAYTGYNEDLECIEGAYVDYSIR